MITAVKKYYRTITLTGRDNSCYNNIILLQLNTNDVWENLLWCAELII